MQVLQVGYKSLKKTVTVTNGSTTEANFILAQAVVQLEEIVTTATGQQRRVELFDRFVDSHGCSCPRSHRLLCIAKFVKGLFVFSDLQENPGLKENRAG